MLSGAPHQSVDALDVQTLFAPLGETHAIGVAVSGGADSLALMLLAAQWVHANPERRACVYSVDHGLRPEAQDEVVYVLAVAKQLGLVAHGLVWTGDKPKTGLQAAARTARYRLMGQAMREDGVEVLLTAHHAQDQAETLLMRLAHGTGLGGLGGIAQFSEVEGVRLFRPLLSVSPEALRAFVLKAGLQPVEDPSNTNPDFERVRWRQFVPLLSRLGLTTARWALFSKRMQRAETALGSLAAQSFAQNCEIDEFGAVYIPLDMLKTSPEELAIRTLQMGLQNAGDRQTPFALAAIEALATSIRSGQTATQTLMGACVDFSASHCIIYREAGRMPDAPVTLAPGQSHIWDQRFKIENHGQQSVTIHHGHQLTRNKLQSLPQASAWPPMVQLYAAPVIYGEGQDILAIGGRVFAPDFKVGYLGP